MEKKGLRVNMGKTKIIVCGMNLDLLMKAGKDPCGVCQTQELVAMQSSVVATNYVRYTRNAVTLKAPCALTLISGAPDALERHGLLMEEE